MKKELFDPMTSICTICSETECVSSLWHPKEQKLECFVFCWVHVLFTELLPLFYKHITRFFFQIISVEVLRSQV